MSGRRKPAGRGALGASGPHARASHEPLPPLTRAGSRLPDLQQQDDNGRQVGQVPGQPEDVHGGGGRRGSPVAQRLRRRRRPLRGSGEDGEKRALRGQGRGRTAGARARGAAWESGPLGPAPDPPLKGDAPSSGFTAHYRGLRLSLGCQRFPLINEITLPCEGIFSLFLILRAVQDYCEKKCKRNDGQ